MATSSEDGTVTYSYDNTSQLTGADYDYQDDELYSYDENGNRTGGEYDTDPNNKLISRGPRFRLAAESIRDVALAASGLLSRKIGGPSVFPPQPAGVWDLPYNDEKWEESRGEDRYRRGIYTFVRRSALHPAMMNFDATSREFCTVRRIRTNTPIQALTTLNEEGFFEMAQALAKRIVREGGNDDRSRVFAVGKLQADHLTSSHRDGDIGQRGFGRDAERSVLGRLQGRRWRSILHSSFLPPLNGGGRA